MRRGELSAATTQLISKCLRSGWKLLKGYKEILSAVLWIVDIHEKKARQKKIKKKQNKLRFTTCKNRLLVYVGEEHLKSFMTEAPII